MIAGSTIQGRVIAARLQHTNYKKTYQDSLEIFVIRPIEDEQLRKSLTADYSIVEQSIVDQMYCSNQDPAALGLRNIRAYSRTENGKTKYCFEKSQLRPKSIDH